jgi:hypothetical protein
MRNLSLYAINWHRGRMTVQQVLLACFLLVTTSAHAISQEDWNKLIAAREKRAACAIQLKTLDQIAKDSATIARLDPLAITEDNRAFWGKLQVPIIKTSPDGDALFRLLILFAENANKRFTIETLRLKARIMNDSETLRLLFKLKEQFLRLDPKFNQLAEFPDGTWQWDSVNPNALFFKRGPLSITMDRRVFWYSVQIPLPKEGLRNRVSIHTARILKALALNMSRPMSAMDLFNEARFEGVDPSRVEQFVQEQINTIIKAFREVMPNIERITQSPSGYTWIQPTPRPGIH